MTTIDSALIAQLRQAISEWTAEVGASQENLGRQIDGANTQLDRLLAALGERLEQDRALAYAHAENERLKQAIEGSTMPAGAVTQYTTSATAPPATSAANQGTIERLQAAVESWTAQVTASQGGLFDQFQTANAQLTQLLELLVRAAEDGTGPASRAAAVEQLEHANGVLEEEVRALNIELETLRQEQAAFATANLAADSERLQKEQQEAENLQRALRTRESELESSRRAESDLARELERLQQQIVRGQQAEEHMQRVVDSQQREAEQHLSALAELTGEMEALRRALLEDDVRPEPTEADDAPVPMLETDDEAARARMEVLEAEIARLESEREQIPVLEARIAELEARETGDSVAGDDQVELNARIAELEARLSGEKDGGEQIAALDARVAELRARPTAEAFAEAQERATAMEAAVEALQSEIAAADDAEAELVELKEQVVELQALLEAARTPGVPSRPVDADEADALYAGLVQMEAELEALKRREEDTVATVRALLGELETSDAGEPAREEALSEAREEIARLQTALEDLELLLHDERAASAALRQQVSSDEESLEALRERVSEHEETLRARESEILELEARVEHVTAAKRKLRQEVSAQQDEIRQAMAQLSQVIHERDELLEELETRKKSGGRIYAGAAGIGMTASEALESRHERARQQEILVSELTRQDHNRSLGQILVDAQILTPDQLESALDEQGKDPSQLLGTILIEREYTTDDVIAQAVACQLHKPIVNPLEVQIQKKAIDLLNKDLCTWHVCIPLSITADRMVVAMANPLDETAILKLRDVSQREITPVVGTPSHIIGAIENHYGSF